MSRMVETCGCGASWEGDSSYREEARGFREAHANCRTPREDPEIPTAIREVGVAIAEAILAAGEAAADRASTLREDRDLIDELTPGASG